MLFICVHSYFDNVWLKTIMILEGLMKFDADDPVVMKFDDL